MIELLAVSIATFALMVLATLAWLYVASRELAELRGSCDEGWGNVQRLLHSRDALLQRFLLLCEGALGEAEELRQALDRALEVQRTAATSEDRARASGDVSKVLRRLLEAALKRPMLPEGFPELKAQLEDAEVQLADWSDRYNAAARRWNAQIGKLPESLVARLEKAQPREPWNVPALGG